jgi:membrane associated rhomboid family serine protease/tetratricopeptide (TPR) repeat protein
MKPSARHTKLLLAYLHALARFYGRPPQVTVILIGLNCVVALAQFAAAGFVSPQGELGNGVIDWALGAKVPSLVADGDYWRLVTASFLHGSWSHLAWNMVALLALGCLLERVIGPSKLLALYVLSCIAGTAASFLFTPDVSLGASTGVMGLMAALLWNNWRRRDLLRPAARLIMPVLLGLLGLQLTLDLFMHRVDLFGHLGGLAGGVLGAAWVDSARLLPSTRSQPRVFAAASLAGLCLIYGAVGVGFSSERALLLQAAQPQEPVDEMAVLNQVVTTRPRFTEARLYLAGLLLTAQRGEEATDHYDWAARLAPKRVAGRRTATLREALGDFHLRRAQQAYQEREWEASSRSFLRSLEFSTQDWKRAEAHNGYAWILVDKLNRDLETAEEHARVATNAAPNRFSYRDTLAWIYFKQERYPEALAEQREAVRLLEMAGQDQRPDAAELFFHLAVIYERVDEREHALFNYARAVRARPHYPEAAAALRRLAVGEAAGEESGVDEEFPEPEDLLPMPDHEPDDGRNTII